MAVWVVDDEVELCVSLCELLKTKGIDADYSSNPIGILDVEATQIDLLLLDVRLGDVNGLDILTAFKRKNPDTPVVMITGYPNVDSAVAAMRFGAANYFTKPLDIPRLIEEINTHLNAVKSTPVFGNRRHGLIGVSPQVRTVLNEIKQVAATDVPVLICGESGTGKELAAQLIHDHSLRFQSQYLKVNCAAIPDTLIESELFGHEKGAFTGAERSRAGKFEAANDGTLFLDEIGELDISVQPKLLRVLQEGEIQRLGSDKTLKVSPRIVAATNRPLLGDIDNAQFREDLYYRLSVVTIEMPPLRQRVGDISVLTKHFLLRYAEQYGKQLRTVNQAVMKLFEAHDWPGNVRELSNCVERAVIFSDDEQLSLQIENLPQQYQRPIKLAEPVPSPLTFDAVSGQDHYDQMMETVSRQKIIDALTQANGVKSKAAQLLNVNRRTLYNWMKKYQLS
ncbi:sigma-54-dependent transcriptional regulator [Thaumasiovibrio subtropicus]|uniref:sigma-54-dependent transcriptional regulator n=1 Tax=Thaumasiovibrio subtropicus TaxID=1891207 RepID=UPI000B3566AF|nr:sigma-54 dependent transcriptional regulator [Thaumasiovibrio subtropicus]